MNAFARYSTAAFSGLIGCAMLASCGITSKLPKVDVPFIGGSGASQHDPVVPYAIGDKLAPGHTLKLSIYAGYRSPSRLFSGDVVVDEKGEVNFGQYGKTKVGGLDATSAWLAINSQFNQKRGEKIITVHLESIEGLRVLGVIGAVQKPSVVQWYDGVNAGNILSYVGGLKVQGQSIYIIHNGRRAYHSSLSAAQAAGELAPGDIVHYSGDL